jgi:trigger factor
MMPGMKVSVEQLSAVERKVHVELPQETVTKELDKAYRELSRTVKIKGFRPGKVPLDLLKRRFGTQVENEVGLQLVNTSFPDALKQGEIEAVSDPRLDREPLLEGQPFRYSVVVEIKPDIVVQDYGKLPVRRKQVQVSDEEVRVQLELRRQANAFLRTLGDGHPVRTGNHALLDFRAFIGGRPVPGGETKGYELEIGSNRFSAEFENKLLGAVKGEEREIEVTYPVDHPNKNLAGQTVRFEVTVKDVMERLVPELDDEFARTTGSAQTLEELRGLTREQVEKQKKKAVDGELRQQLVDELVARNPFELPQGMVERELQRLLETLRYRLAAQNVSLEQAGIQEGTFKQQNRDRAEKSARATLLLERLAAQEDLVVSDDELEEGLRQSAEELNRPLEKVKDFYRKNNLTEPLRRQLLEEKVVRLLLDQADITEVSPDLPGSTDRGEEKS